MLKKGNKAYIVFLATTTPILLFFLLSNLIFGNTTKSVSQNYQSTLAFSDYLLKIDHATYNTDTNELKFTSYLKIKYDNGQTEPNIYSISLDYALDEFAPFSVSRDTLNQFASSVSIPNVSENFKYVRIFYQSKKADTYVAEKYDEFGNIIPAQTITGETMYISIIIDKNDITFIDNSTAQTSKVSEEIFDEDNIVSVESQTKVTSKKPKETTTSLSTSVQTTTPRVTTATKKTSQSATQSVVTTTKKKVTTTTTTTKKPTVTATTPEQTTTKKPATVTTTPKVTTTTVKPTTTVKKTTTTPKVTTTTKKATTTTKKPVVTTTTTKKKVTTTTTTTKATTTTTTVYIRLTGLALAEKGSEELLLGESVTLTPVYTPSKATNKKVYWSSNRPDRVIVDSNGKCTAVGVGSAIIICTSDDGGLTAAYMITGVDG